MQDILLDFSFTLLDNIVGDKFDKFYIKNNWHNNYVFRPFWR